MNDQSVTFTIVSRGRIFQVSPSISRALSLLIFATDLNQEWPRTSRLLTALHVALPEPSGLPTRRGRMDRATAWE